MIKALNIMSAAYFSRLKFCAKQTETNTLEVYMFARFWVNPYSDEVYEIVM